MTELTFPRATRILEDRRSSICLVKHDLLNIASELSPALISSSRNAWRFKQGDRYGGGMIALNLGLMSDPAAPFGGAKQRGIGREGGQGHGIAEFMEAKYLAVAM